MKNIAYGSLKLRPNEFWNLTLVELAEMHNAFIEEENRCEEVTYWRTAWLASHIMNATGNLKSPVTPQKLMAGFEKLKEKSSSGKTGQQKPLRVDPNAIAELKKKFGYEQ